MVSAIEDSYCRYPHMVVYSFDMGPVRVRVVSMSEAIVEKQMKEMRTRDFVYWVGVALEGRHVLTASEVERVKRSIRATGKLGAEDALMAAHTGKDNGLTEREVGRLRTYAAALEGEDG